VDTVNDKYYVFKRSDNIAITDGYVTFATDAELPDGVVIRRQDLFAAPALDTYASMIAMVAHNVSDPELGKELLAIADYFADQARLAHEEGKKLPDR
jgi:hypothetical protein